MGLLFIKILCVGALANDIFVHAFTLEKIVKSQVVTRMSSGVTTADDFPLTPRRNGQGWWPKKPLVETEDALDLFYVEIGAEHHSGGESSFSKPPIIVIHGLLGQSKNFGTWAKDLKKAHKDRRVFLVDLRNHGNSPHHPAMGYHLMAADLLRLIERLGCGSAILVGHSMGGKVAMATSLLAPSKVHALCVIDIAPVRYTDADEDWRLTEEIVKQLANLPLSSLKTKRDADRHLSTEMKDPMMRGFALMNVDEVRDSEAGGMSWRINLDAIVNELSTLAGADVGGISNVRPFSRPTLFIKGSSSQFFREEKHMGRTAVLFPTAGLESIEGANHWIHVTKPTELHEVVSGFLRSTGVK